jgi:mono/diheme cytochrome c family protein
MHVVRWVRVPGFVAVATLVALAAVRADQRLATAADAPTYARDVAPILFANCAVCHRPGQAAPFSLLSYQDARRHADLIVEATETRYMPPWHAARAEGFPEFVDERRLTDAQLATLRRWADAGAPAGDLTKAPPPPTFASGWTLGTPDLVVKLPKPLAVPAEGRDLYRNALLAVDLPEDRWIRAIEFQPTARTVVHHVLFFTTAAGVAVRDDEPIPGLGARGAGRGQGRGVGGIGQAADAWGGLGGWVPGVTPRFFPDSIAQPFPRHSNLVAQFHLHPSGKAEVEQGSLAIYFSTSPPARSLSGVQVPPAFGFGMGIDIPPGEKAYTIRDSFVLPVDVEAFGARAHAHYLARRMTMTARLPDGRTQGLLKIDDWDFGWQDSYFFKTPVRLPRGSSIDVTIVYDNTEDNLRNPHSPPQRVRWGQGSLDEMGSMSLLVGVPTGSPDQLALRMSQTAQLLRQLRRQ